MMRIEFMIAAGVLFLLIDFLVARDFYLTAAAKGWNSKKYFFYAFFLLFVGYLLVLALPDRGSGAAGSFDSRDLPEL